MTEVVVGGLDRGVLLERVRAHLRLAKPTAVGVAMAYVSVSGIRRAISLVKQVGVDECRLIAGIDHAITHPEALKIGLGEGWSVRIGKSKFGLFHPKLIVGGRKFRASGAIEKASFSYVGSGNLTDGGLLRNVESAFLTQDETIAADTSSVFAKLWNTAVQADATMIRNYSAFFAEQTRRRSPEELLALGLLEEGDSEASTEPAIGEAFAAAAWAGLESTTGEFRYQVEFPREAASVLRKMVGTSPGADFIPVLCEDGRTIDVKFAYYARNGMFRLNLPNDVPGVSRARKEKAGIVLVERGPEGGAPIRLRILPPGSATDAVVARSRALGTLHRTSTRFYGWL